MHLTDLPGINVSVHKEKVGRGVVHVSKSNFTLVLSIVVRSAVII